MGDDDDDDDCLRLCVEQIAKSFLPFVVHCVIFMPNEHLITFDVTIKLNRIKYILITNEISVKSILLLKKNNKKRCEIVFSCTKEHNAIIKLLLIADKILYY